MLQFKGIKSIDQVQKDAIKQGWEVDTTEFDKGSDWFCIRDLHVRTMQVVINCFGRFAVYAPISTEPIATELSEELDNQEWYKEILNLIYCQ